MRVAAIVVVCAVTGAPAAAHPPITDRNYRLDLYQGTVIGSGRIIGMGGAAAALVQEATGMAINPAAPAVRAPNSHADWDVDGTVDWLIPSFSNDFDNNGEPRPQGSTRLLTLAACSSTAPGAWASTARCTGPRSTSRAAPRAW